MVAMCRLNIHLVLNLINKRATSTPHAGVNTIPYKLRHDKALHTGFPLIKKPVVFFMDFLAKTLICASLLKNN